MSCAQSSYELLDIFQNFSQTNQKFFSILSSETRLRLLSQESPGLNGAWWKGLSSNNFLRLLPREALASFNSCTNNRGSELVPLDRLSFLRLQEEPDRGVSWETSGHELSPDVPGSTSVSIITILIMTIQQNSSSGKFDHKYSKYESKVRLPACRTGWLPQDPEPPGTPEAQDSVWERLCGNWNNCTFHWNCFFPWIVELF